MKNLLFSLFLFCIIINVNAQQKDSSEKITAGLKSEIVFKDGTILRGIIVRQNDSLVILNTDVTGQIAIARDKILNIRYFTSAKTGGQQVYINLASRYFFPPSAINMK